MHDTRFEEAKGRREQGVWIAEMGGKKGGREWRSV
jgi:hypothetical protein